MGHVRATVRITNPYDRSFSAEVPAALITTGATRTLIPRSLANELRLRLEGNREVRTAAGIQRLDQAAALITLQGEETFGDVWVSDSFPSVLVGVVTLESLGLAVDPSNERLVKREFLLL